MTKTLFRFWVNWDGTGTYAESDEITDYVMESDWFLGCRKTFASIVDEGTASITVRNTDGRFSPQNPASPLYGNMKPYRRAKIEADYNGIITPLWAGFLELPAIGWMPMGPDLTGKHTVQLSAVGAKQLIEGVEVNLGIYTNTTGDVIIYDALVEAGIYPSLTGVWLLGSAVLGVLGETTSLSGDASTWTDIEIGATTFASYGDNSRNAWKVIQEISDGERGWFWIGRDGKYHWWNRHHKITNLALAATLNSTTETVYGLVGAEYRYGDDLANVVRVSITPRQTASSQVLWSLDSPITLGVGATEIIEARLRKDGGQFVGASSLSNSPTWSSGSGSVTVEALGGVARITITNTGSGAAVLSALTLSGAPTQAQNTMTVEESDSGSVGEIGRRDFALSLTVGGGYADAQNIALYELTRRGILQGTVRSISLREVPNNAQTVSTVWQIGLRYRMAIDSLHIDADYWCVGENHTWKTGNVHDVTLYVEPASASEFWVLGESGFSELGETTTVVY
jgi:hypothetical protein